LRFSLTLEFGPKLLSKALEIFMRGRNSLNCELGEQILDIYIKVPVNCPVAVGEHEVEGNYWLQVLVSMLGKHQEQVTEHFLYEELWIVEIELYHDC
jgi:hypothetical protein